MSSKTDTIATPDQVRAAKKRAAAAAATEKAAEASREQLRGEAPKGRRSTENDKA
jgi:hypothetical protein